MVGVRILIYTGKGGVGKTSITCATAVALARQGKRVMVMSTDMAHSLKDCFGRKEDMPSKKEEDVERHVSIDLEQIGSCDSMHVMDNLDALEINPMEESKKAWGNLRAYLKEIISEKANGGIEADEVLMFPGLDELFCLLRILDVYESGQYDVILVDCAPTGETLSLLSYPEKLKMLADTLLPSVRSMNKAFGGLISRKTSVPKPKDLVFEEFDRVVGRLSQLQKLLNDRELTSIRLVMTPEQIVVAEAKRSYTWISEYDFNVDAVYVNKIYPEEAMEGYFAPWKKMQEMGLREIGQSFEDSKIFYLKLQAEELRGPSLLEKVSKELYGEGNGNVQTDCRGSDGSEIASGGSEDPAKVFAKRETFWLEEEDGTKILMIRLPYSRAEEIMVEKEENDLLLTVRNQTRRFHLPEKLRRRTLSKWKYESGELCAFFDY